MTTTTTHYEYYNTLHHDFCEAYQIINRYVLGLYTLPKKFIEETKPLLDRLMTEYSVPGVPQAGPVPSKMLMDFLRELDDFTVGTMKLFEEHKILVNSYRAYIKKVDCLQAKHQHGRMEEYTKDYVQLTPGLIQMHSDLKRVEDKADDMADNLELLQTRWLKIKLKIV